VKVFLVSCGKKEVTLRLKIMKKCVGHGFKSQHEFLNVTVALATDQQLIHNCKDALSNVKIGVKIALT